MKSLKSNFVLGAVFIIALALTACNQSKPTAPLPLDKTGTVTLIVVHTITNDSSIAINNGNLSLNAFNVNLSKINIQENSGFDGEYRGEHNDGDSTSNDNKTEKPDLELSGPFNFDIAQGSVSIGSFDVYPGIFKQVDLYFLTETNSPFNGNSIVINGKFINTSGVEIPFSLNSKFSKSLQTLIAGGGITVAQNTNTPITITFDFNKIFANMNFGDAVITNGTILIDDTNNLVLLRAFEQNLNNSIELESK